MSAATARMREERENEREKETERETEVMRAARRFGVASFRPGQRALIDAVLAGRDVIAVMPRAEQSLCWLLPSLLLPKLTVIVTNTLEDLEPVETPLGLFGRAPRVYVTAERLATEDCISLLRRNGVSRLVVEDAHRVCRDALDHRAAYGEIAAVSRRLGAPPILALTTCDAGDTGDTDDTIRDIRRLLTLRKALVVLAKAAPGLKPGAPTALQACSAGSSPSSARNRSTAQGASQDATLGASRFRSCLARSLPQAGLSSCRCPGVHPVHPGGMIS